MYNSKHKTYFVNWRTTFSNWQFYISLLCFFRLYEYETISYLQKTFEDFKRLHFYKNLDELSLSTKINWAVLLWLQYYNAGFHFSTQCTVKEVQWPLSTTENPFYLFSFSNLLPLQKNKMNSLLSLFYYKLSRTILFLYTKLYKIESLLYNCL